METMERAKFGGIVEVDAVTLTFADGHTQEFVGEDARTLGLKPTSKPNAISALQILKYSFEERG